MTSPNTVCFSHLPICIVDGFADGWFDLNFEAFGTRDHFFLKESQENIYTMPPELVKLGLSKLFKGSVSFKSVAHFLDSTHWGPGVKEPGINFTQLSDLSFEYYAGCNDDCYFNAVYPIIINAILTEKSNHPNEDMSEIFPWLGLCVSIEFLGDAPESNNPKLINDAINLLLGILKEDNDPYARAEAADALGKFRTPKVVDGLIEALNDPHAEVRKSVIWSLRDIGPKVEDLLIKALNDPDRRVRHAAVRALERIGGSKAVDALVVRAFEDPEGYVRLEAAEVIGELKSLDGLITLLNAPDVRVCRKAVSKLGKFDDPKARDALIGALSDSDIYVRLEAAFELDDPKNPRVIDTLIAVLDCDDIYACYETVDYLSKINNRKVADALTSFLRELLNGSLRSRFLGGENNYSSKEITESIERMKTTISNALCRMDRDMDIPYVNENTVLATLFKFHLAEREGESFDEVDKNFCGINFYLFDKYQKAQTK